MERCIRSAGTLVFLSVAMMDHDFWNVQKSCRPLPKEIIERLITTFTSNGKREFVPRDQVSSFTCLLLFIISTHKLVVSRDSFLSIRIVLRCFYPLIFYLRNSQLELLTFAVCGIREA